MSVPTDPRPVRTRSIATSGEPSVGSADPPVAHRPDNLAIDGPSPASAAGRHEAPPSTGAAAHGRLHELLIRRRVRLPGWLRFSRYTAGSAICFAVSELVFVALFWPGFLGSKGAAIVASIAGIIPGYFLNRSWTWGRTGKSDFWREVVPYWATALISTALAALGTGAANAIFADEPRSVRTVINAVAYMLVYGVLFVAKYVIFHRWLFAPDRSRHPAGAAPE